MKAYELFDKWVGEYRTNLMVAEEIQRRFKIEVSEETIRLWRKGSNPPKKSMRPVIEKLTGKRVKKEAWK